MRRSPMIGVFCALLVVLAGCAGTPTGDPVDTTNSITETCRLMEQRDHPDFPETITQETALQFVEEYVEVTLWNEVIVQKDKKYQRARISAKGFIVNTTETGYVVHVRYTLETYDCNGAVGDGMGDTIDLFINESVLVMNRSSIGGPDHTSDPSKHSQVGVDTILNNGTVLQRRNESST